MLRHQKMCIRVVKIRNPRIMKILVMSSQIFRTHSTFLMVQAPTQVSMIMVQYISILSSPNSRFFTTPATCRAGLCIGHHGAVQPSVAMQRRRCRRFHLPKVASSEYTRTLIGRIAAMTSMSVEGRSEKRTPPLAGRRNDVTNGR